MRVPSGLARLSLVLSVTAAAAAPASAGDVGMLVLEGPLAEKPSPFSWLTGDTGATLRGVIDAIDAAAEDDLDGLVIRLKDAQLTTAQIEELGQAMQRFRDSGKRLHVFAEFFTAPEIMLASFADEAILQAGGATMFTGLHMEEMYLADMFAWVGVEPDFVQVGDYKGASESMMNAQPSPKWDAHLNEFLDDVYGNMRRIVSRGRGLSDEQLDDAMRQSFLADGKAAIATGLIDAEVDLPVLGDHLAQAYGSEIEWTDVEPESAESPIDTSNPFAIFSVLSKTPDHSPTRPTIAVLHINGTIVDGDSQPAGLFGQGNTVGSRTIRNTIETIRDEDLIKGVVVRINSPGGSAIASEVMWQGLRRLAETKPVWVSVGDMAASGGYYLAVGGDRIYANTSSIVGSIGVVGGKLATRGLMEDKLHINIVPRSRGPLAGIMGASSPWSDTERAAVRHAMQETYDLFLSRVTAARSGIDVSRTAEGRIFIGARAVELAMVDEIGTLDDAIVDLAADRGLDTYDVMDFPGPKGFEEFLEESFGGFVRSPAAGVRSQFYGVLEAAVGPRAWPAVRDALNALALLRDQPVVLTAPRAIIFR